jgi:8-oxo-dGTP pyrophosphatase MutT (NUDIX family)/RimJ/RimL family protein N-acetyltransferase
MMSFLDASGASRRPSTGSSLPRTVPGRAGRCGEARSGKPMKIKARKAAHQATKGSDEPDVPASPEKSANGRFRLHKRSEYVVSAGELMKAVEPDPSWFAGSRLVDSKGKPIVLYRGTRRAGNPHGALSTRSYTDSSDIGSIYSGTPGPSYKGGSKFGEGANVFPVHMVLKNPLDLTKHGPQMSFGHYLRAMKYGKPNGMTHEEAVKVLNYLSKRHVKDMNMDGESSFKVNAGMDPWNKVPYEDQSGFMHMSTPLMQARDDFKDMETDTKSAFKHADNIRADTFAFVDAPRTPVVGKRLGYDGIIHRDIFQGVTEAAPNLLGKDPGEIQALSREYDHLADPEDHGADELQTHITYRPFDHDQQVRSAINGRPLPPVKKSDSEDLEKMALANIALGKPTGTAGSDGTQAFDYSHLLKPEHQKAGHQLIVESAKTYKRGFPEAGDISATMYDKENNVLGQVVGRLHEHQNSKQPMNYQQGSLNIGLSDLDNGFQGQGMGSSMYTAIMAHAKNHHGCTTDVSGVHSTAASRARASVARQQGLDYKPVLNPHPTPSEMARRKKGDTAFDGMFGPHEMELKSELPASLTKMALSTIPVGPLVSNPVLTPFQQARGAIQHDYTKRLPEEYQRLGYRLVVNNTPASSKGPIGNGPRVYHINANLLDKGNNKVGEVSGQAHLSAPNVAEIDYTDLIDNNLKGRGLGSLMYETFLAHVRNHHGCHTVQGEYHSTDANRVHNKMARVHELPYRARDLKPERNGIQHNSNESSFDNRFGPYRYGLGKGEDLEKMALSTIPVPPGAPKADEPVVTSHDYSFRLPKEYQDKGFKLHVRHWSDKLTTREVRERQDGWPAGEPLLEPRMQSVALLYPSGNRLGVLDGRIDWDAPKTARIDYQEIRDEDMKKKGFGKLMVEAFNAHARNHFGCHTVLGSYHSGPAARTHVSVTRDHELEGYDQGNPDHPEYGKPYKYGLGKSSSEIDSFGPSPKMDKRVIDTVMTNDIRKASSQEPPEWRDASGRFTEEAHSTMKRNWSDHTELVPIDEVLKYIQVDRRNDAAQNRALADDIKTNGIREPLMLTYHQREKTLTLGEGHHRLIAAGIAGLKEVPVRVARNTTNHLAGDTRYLPAVPAPTPYPERNGYVPGDLRPSDIGIRSREPMPMKPMPMKPSLGKGELSPSMTSAVTCIIEHWDGRILFGRRQAGGWTFPGGHVEAGEQALDAAKRELMEEAGLEVKTLREVGQANGGPKGEVPVSIFFGVSDGEPTSANDPDNEVEEWRWVDCSSGVPAEIMSNLAHQDDVAIKLMGFDRIENHQANQAVSPLSPRAKDAT